jgi:hypothetical protein
MLRRTAVLFSAIIALACAKGDDVATTTATTDTTAVAATPADITLADVAGAWSLDAMGEHSDTVLTHYQLWLSEDTATWKLKFEGRSDTVQVHFVGMAGDSIMATTGPYDSQLRKGVSVTTNTTWRIKDGQLIGLSVAHYTVPTPDSVRIIRTRGTRVQ